MIKSTWLLVTVGLAAAALSSACGSDASGSSGQFASGLSGSESLGSLSDADVQTLCASLGDYLASDTDFRAATCHFAGIGAALTSSVFGGTDEQAQMACTSTESACNSASASESQSCQKPTGACDATVSEFETCVTDTLREVSATLSSLPACTAIKVSDLTASPSSGSDVTQLPEPASCQTVQAKCPSAQSSTGLSPATGGS